MDVLDRVREFGADVELTESQVADASERVSRGLRPDAASHRARRMWIGGAGGALAAAAAAAAILVAVAAPQPGAIEAVTPTPTAPEVIVTAPPPTTPPVEVVGAAAVLELAAEMAPTTDPQLQAGQFLRIVRDIEYVVTHGVPGDGSEFGVTRENADSAWVVTGRYVTYMPADRAGEWVRVFEPEIGVTQYFGTDAQVYAAQWLAMVQRTEPIVERIMGGLDHQYEEGGPVYASDAYFAQMPRDPEDLLAWQRARITTLSPEEVEEAVVMMLIQDLELNAAPADLRASMFRALSLIDDVDVRSVEGPITTLGFTFDSFGARSATMSIDTETGLVVSSTNTAPSGASIVPADIPDNRVSTTWTVVDSAP